MDYTNNLDTLRRLQAMYPKTYGNAMHDPITSAQSALNAGFAPLGTPEGVFPVEKPEPVSLINTSQQLEYRPPLPTGLDSSQQSAIDAGFSDAGESQFDVDGSTMPMPMQGMGNKMQALA